jgi:hypothetical protein
MDNTLSLLFTKSGLNRFVECYDSRQPLHISGEPVSRFDTVLTVGHLDAFFQSEQLPAAFFNAVTHGVQHPIEQWSRIEDAARGQERVAVPELLLDLYGNGATLIINKAHASLPALGETCRRLSRELGFLVGANVYITPPESQGIQRHADPHDVVILQISGGKSWILYPPHGPPQHLSMQPGDVLFIPRHLSHAARCEESSSIHATLGLNPIHLFHLVQELASAAAEHPDFQRIASPKFGEAVLGLSFDADFRLLLEKLLTEITAGQLLSRRLAAFVHDQRQGWHGRFHDLLRIGGLSPESIVQARRGIVTEYRRDEESLHVSFCGKSVAVPKFLTESVKALLGGELVIVQELQGMLTDSGKVSLVTSFVKAGLLRIEKL